MRATTQVARRVLRALLWVRARRVCKLRQLALLVRSAITCEVEIVTLVQRDARRATLRPVFAKSVPPDLQFSLMTRVSISTSVPPIMAAAVPLRVTTPLDREPARALRLERPHTAAVPAWRLQWACVALQNASTEYRLAILNVAALRMVGAMSPAK